MVLFSSPWWFWNCWMQTNWCMLIDVPISISCVGLIRASSVINLNPLLTYVTLQCGAMWDTKFDKPINTWTLGKLSTLPVFWWHWNSHCALLLFYCIPHGLQNILCWSWDEWNLSQLYQGPVARQAWGACRSSVPLRWRNSPPPSSFPRSGLGGSKLNPFSRPSEKPSS